MKQTDALKVLQSGKNVFLTGEPGAGKTHTVNEFIKWALANDKKVAVTASTGIAATHINGMTIHSFCGIGIKRKLFEGDVDAIWRNHFKARQIALPDILIIDEISMLDANTLDMVNEVLNYSPNFGGAGKAFGGKQIIFVGDFFQLPPVPDRFKKKEPVRFAYEADSWKHAAPVICYLTEQHRQNDTVFLDLLTSMRAGTLTEKHKNLLLSRNDIPVHVSESTLLYTHNEDVDRLNADMLSEIDEEPHVYDMASEGHEVAVSILKKQCLSPERLDLKTGALVMFTRNNWDTGYVNGTIGTVTEFLRDGLPVVTTKDGKEIVVLRAEWKFVNSHGQATASIKQLPLRLAWAMTIHKSQGMSLDQAHIDLSGAFEFGQGYVALSRVRSLKGLTLEGFNKKALQMHPKVVEQDIVFRMLSAQRELEYVTRQ